MSFAVTVHASNGGWQNIWN